MAIIYKTPVPVTKMPLTTTPATSMPLATTMTGNHPANASSSATVIPSTDIPAVTVISSLVTLFTSPFTVGITAAAAMIAISISAPAGAICIAHAALICVATAAEAATTPAWIHIPVVIVCFIMEAVGLIVEIAVAIVAATFQVINTRLALKKRKEEERKKKEEQKGEFEKKVEGEFQ
ncbi:hypothetical protein N0V85_003971 [Neurospora sp. IMI 360204]|nr:hypothetical protein N0V85_003971 [Neurospora sp. IMI 360204]